MHQFNVVQSDWGIGDILCSLYAIKGLSEKYPNCKIFFYVRQHLEWVRLFDLPNVEVYKFREDAVPEAALFLYNDKDDADKRVKHTSSPKNHFASVLNVQCRTPILNKEHFHERPKIEGEYIVLSPFASRINRTWEIHNWRILANQLKDKGYRVIAIDSPFQSKRCKEIGVEYFWGQPADWILNVCKNARLIIGNDSGIAHLGGILGTPTIVVMAQLDGGQFYDYTTNRIVAPNIGCSGCKFLPEGGYEEKCDYGCWVLQSVKPQTVYLKALEWLQEPVGKISTTIYANA